MKLDCPHCGVSGSAKDSYIGQKVKCPKCNGVFEVSETETAEETTPIVTKEETLEWEDIASEIDSQDAGDEVSEKEDAHEGSPAELSSWDDDSQKPTDFDFNEEDVQVKDETGETILRENALEKLQQDDLKFQEDDVLEDPPLLFPAGSEVAEPELTPQDHASILNDDLQLAQKEVQEEDNIELGSFSEIDKKQCRQCGKQDNAGESFITRDGGLYCSDCSLLEDRNMASDTQSEADEIPSTAGPDIVDSGFMDDKSNKNNNDFTIANIIREAWEKTKGAKGTIWAGSAVMYLVLLVIVAGGAFLFPSVAGEPVTLTEAVGNALFQTVADFLSILFTAGLFLMGIKRTAGETIHWKMIFKGFSCAGKIIAASILQFILIFIGLLLLVLPGIYLIVGYTMTIPLIIDKGLSPWQAMEMSRKAVHKVWWRVMGIICIMVLIIMVSFIPLGIGLIWTWPMFIILVGVMYQHFFGVEKEERSIYGTH